MIERKSKTSRHQRGSIETPPLETHPYITATWHREVQEGLSIGLPLCQETRVSRTPDGKNSSIGSLGLAAGTNPLHGIMESGNYGKQESWNPGIMESGNYGTQELWKTGILESKNYGIQELWKTGIMESGNYGIQEF